MGTLDGDGSLKIVAGCLTGRYSRKPRTPAVNSFDVVAKLVVRDAAYPRKPNLLALGCQLWRQLQLAIQTHRM